MLIQAMVVTQQYPDALYIQQMLEWESLGFELLTELNPISALQKVRLIRPQVLILFGTLGAADPDMFLEEVQKLNEPVHVVMLSSRHTQTWNLAAESSVFGRAKLYFIPKLTVDTLMKVIEDIRLTQQLERQGRSIPSGQLGKCSSLQPLASGVWGRDCELLWVRLESAAVLTHLQIEDILCDQAEASSLRWVRWQPDIYLVLLQESSQAGGASGQLGWLLDGTYGAVQILSIGVIARDQLEASVARLQSLDRHRYFFSDVRLFRENSGTVHRRILYPTEVASLLGSLLIASIQGETAEACNVIRKLYLEQIKPFMSFTALDLLRHILGSTYRLLCGQSDMSGLFSSQMPSCVEDEAQMVCRAWTKIMNQREPVQLSQAVVSTIRRLNSNFSSDLSLKMLAEEHNMSESGLSKLFRRQVGCKVISYLIHLRIQVAALFLLQSDWPVNQIAQKVGFWDAKYFSRVFRQEIGVSPSEYRRRSQQPYEEGQNQ